MEVDNENAADPSADPDPIIASYKIYANPALATSRKLLILQHPNNQGPTNQPYAQVSDVRIKNRSAMIEVDVPISHALADYDRDKGQRWGGALAKSLAAKNGGTHGLAGGFGVGVSALRPSKRRDELERDIDMMGWSEAVRQDKVLRTKTLGGQIPAESETECQWMVGVFKGSEFRSSVFRSLTCFITILFFKIPLVSILTRDTHLSRSPPSHSRLRAHPAPPPASPYRRHV